MGVKEALRSRVLTSRLGDAWYRFWELRQAFSAEARLESRRHRGTTASDGFPVPGARRIVGIGSSASTAWYLESGVRDLRRIFSALGAAGIDPEALGTVLDFGCGCGRITRGLHAWRAAHLVGCDIDAAAVHWCRQNLPGEFHAISLDPPLPLAAASVDLAIAFSVFTHLDAARFGAWLEELHRVLAPEGTLVMTVHGNAYRGLLPEDLQAKFDGGEIVVRYARSAGSNLCAAFHPRPFVERALAERFELVTVEEGDSTHAAPQDLYIARR
jgi:SAM-dependent methyltransferase